MSCLSLVEHRPCYDHKTNGPQQLVQSLDISISIIVDDGRILPILILTLSTTPNHHFKCNKNKLSLFCDITTCTLTSFTVAAFESSRTLARVAVHFVNASGSVLAGCRATVVNIYSKKMLQIHLCITYA